MKTLIVSIERNGKMMKVGAISGNGVSDSRFQYSEEHGRRITTVDGAHQ